jgi:hypothetical protein
MTYAGAGAQQRASGWPEKSFLLFADAIFMLHGGS